MEVGDHGGYANQAHVWGVVQWQDSRFWSVQSRFKSGLPSFTAGTSRIVGHWTLDHTMVWFSVQRLPARPAARVREYPRCVTRLLRLLPLLLALAGCLAILVAVGLDSVPLAGAWLGATWLIAVLWLRAPVVRLPLAIVLLPACVVLTWEGGLFFVPAAMALIGVSLIERGRRLAT